MTSLEMVGFSISALKLENASTESLYIQGLDYPVPEVHAWPSNVFKLEQQTDNSSLTRKTITNATGKFNSKIPIKTENGRLFMRSVVAACRALFASESALNQLDKVAGDGDCGLSMCSGANKILSQIIIESPTLPSSSIIPFDLPHDALSCISLLLDDSMGGSSGALLMIFLDAASAKLQTAAVSGNGMEFNVSVWAQALEAGLEAVKFYGGAKVGDRSMVDVLEPAIRALTTISRNEEVYDPLLIRNSVGSAAVAGAESTKGLVAGVGRSSYLSESSLQGSIDPGAYAMQLVIEAILATTLKQ